MNATETATREYRLERVKSLPKCRICAYDSYEQTRENGKTVWAYVHAPEPGSAISSNDLHDMPGRKLESLTVAELDELAAQDRRLFVVPAWLGFGEYNGSTVHASNQQVFLKRFCDDSADFPGMSVAHGGHEFSEVAVDLAWLLSADCADDLLDTLEALDGYPIIDENALSELESDRIETAWNGWAAREFESELSREFGVDVETGSEPTNNPEALREMFETVLRRENVYWENCGSNDSMSVDVARVSQAVELEELRPFISSADYETLASDD